MVIEAVLLARKHVSQTLVAQARFVVESLSLTVLSQDLGWVRVVHAVSFRWGTLGTALVILGINLEFKVVGFRLANSIAFNIVEALIGLLGPSIEVE